MELLDYLRLRAKWLALLFVLGVVVIGLVGRTTTQKDYRASAQMVVLPASDQQSAYAGDSDRYVATEMRLMYRPTVLKAAASSANVSYEGLARTLNFNHPKESDTVTLTVTSASREAAITSVNAVAKAYLADAEARDRDPYEARQKDLASEISSASKALTAANEKIAAAGTAYAKDNPDRPNSNPSLLSPGPYSDSVRYQGKLQVLTSQQAQAIVTGAPEIRSGLLRSADGASRPAGWGLTTYLAAIVGWLLVLLAAAGVLAALSKRVLGPTRWNSVATGLSVRNAVILQRGPTILRRNGLNRLAQLVARNSDPGAPALVTFSPQRTRALDTALGAIQSRLATGEAELEEVDTIDDAMALVGRGSSGDTRAGGLVFLLVDVGRSRMDEIESLGDFPEALQRRIVPVLV